jgi:hypothetical protein
MPNNNPLSPYASNIPLSLFWLFFFFEPLPDIQFLWDKCQQNHEPNMYASESPLLTEFARNLAAALPSYTASMPITPQWVFSPFLKVLKQVIGTVVSSDSSRVVRISSPSFVNFNFFVFVNS